MSKSPDNIVKLSETLTMCEYKSDLKINYADAPTGFWLYDKTRGMNLSMRAKSEADAFIEALHYYQKRLTEVEQEHTSLQKKVYVFISQFAEYDAEYDSDE